MLKGKTIIELTDVNTGEKEVIEENNMVTNAINDLFNTLPNILNPYSIYKGSAWYMSDFQRLYEFLLGGILLFDGQIEEKAENTFAPADVNLVGCGVYNHKNSSTKNKVRGDYNGAESEFNEEQKYMKFVYDFSTSEANGTIASVCLTSYYGGCTSYGNKEAEFMKNTDGNRSQNYYNFCKHVFYKNSRSSSNEELTENSNMPRCFSGDVNYKKAINDKDYSIILTPDEFRSNIISSAIYDKEHPIFVDIDEDAVYYLKTKHETHFNSYWIAKRKAYLKSVSILDFPMAKGELIEEVEVISDISFEKHTNYEGKYYCYDVAQQCLYIFAGGYSSYSNNADIELIKVDLSNGLTNAKGQEITVKNMTGVTVDITSYSKPFVSNGFLYVNKYTGSNDTIKPEIYKIEIANPANVKKLKDETIPNYQSNGINVWYDTTQYYRPIYEHCGTIYMNNGYIIRNDEVLRTELSYFYYDSSGYTYAYGNYINIIPILKNKKSSPFIYISAGSSPSSSCSSTYLYLYSLYDAFCYLFNYLATINNLAEPVTKTADKTMKITYIIQETEPEEAVP